MIKRYGIPYMGSKNSILQKICKIFPKADNFYDLFGGGGSVTHFMIETRLRDFKTFYFNEIKKGIPKLIQDAVNGKYNYENFKPEFIGRDKFFASIDDEYIRCLWSFGNNGKSYLFSKEIEPYKKSMHDAIIFNKFNDLAKEVLGMNSFKEGYSVKDRRLFLRNRIEYYRVNGIPKILHQFLNEKQLQRLQQLEQLEQLQQLQRLQQLQQLEQLQQLQRPIVFSALSYDDVLIKPNSIIYCDIPYRGAADYGNSFNHDAFYNWANEQVNPVFISEYSLPDDRFKKIYSIKKRSLLCKTDESINTYKEEKIFVNKAGHKAFVKYHDARKQ